MSTLANGEGVTLHVKVDGFVNQGVHTDNVIAEMPGGDRVGARHRQGRVVGDEGLGLEGRQAGPLVPDGMK